MSKTFINVALLVLSIGLAVAGQLSMKAGMNKVGEIKSEDLKHPFELIGRVIKSAWAVIGVLLYAISAVFWLVVLSRVNLSVAYPIVAVGYVVVVLYSWLVFKEPVKWFTWIGLAFIVMGVVITAQGLKSETTSDNGSLKAPAGQVAAASGDLSVKNETGLGNTD
ncbi:MAG: SMR family transporter [Actinobacteria bacterium]|nr:SMR family transporter [Actinomycetota bacterium]